MITRDHTTGNITITPEDIPAIAGLIGSSKDRLLADKDKIPGSFAHIFEDFIDAADRFEKARAQIEEEPDREDDDSHDEVAFTGSGY